MNVKKGRVILVKEFARKSRTFQYFGFIEDVTEAMVA